MSSPAKTPASILILSNSQDMGLTNSPNGIAADAALTKQDTADR
jgi:hypothetical protein